VAGALPLVDGEAGASGGRAAGRGFVISCFKLEVREGRGCVLAAAHGRMGQVA
jgi:hypothetical protein